jgi:shikimate dehydrogenase
MRLFGLIGKTLKHSFSKQYFNSKFEKEAVDDANYELFELQSINEFPELIKKYRGKLTGLNVTIPYKKEVIPFLDEIDAPAAAIDAVNTIKVMPNGKLKGYNTDYLGFKNALNDWPIQNKKALVLGTGGASQAIIKVLTDLGLAHQSVSRKVSEGTIDYETLKKNKSWLVDFELIINSTPLGTFPNIDEKPDLPYSQLTRNHLLFDLVYNPETTAYMKEGLKYGAQVKNGYDMLTGQAEASWEIWNR